MGADGLSRSFRLELAFSLRLSVMIGLLDRLGLRLGVWLGLLWG